jgi:RNA polymerase sigma factor for flagellar operon FliA
MDKPASQRERLILEHLPAIKHIASRFFAALPPFMDLADLVGEGVFGLLSAAERFDPTRGVKFKTYAETRIRGAILDSLRNHDWVPRSLRRKFKKLNRAFKELEQRLGRPATESEISEEIGIGIGELRRLAVLSQSASACLWNHRHQHEAANAEPEAIRVIDSRQDTLLRIHQSEIRNILADAIGKLPRRERLVISLYYFDELTMKEIGRVLGVKESRVSQFHSRAKSKLYSRLRKVLSPDPLIWWML